MLHRRSFLAALAGGLAVATATSHAEAAPAPAAAMPVGDAPRTVEGLRAGLAGAAGEPREMQYYYRRPYRPYRRYYYARPRVVRRCVWTGYGRVCRWVRVW
jgi:hypothetical protein